MKKTLFTLEQRRALHEANQEDDAGRRALANHAWDRVVKFVRAALEAGDFEEKTSPHMATGGFVLPSKVANDLAIVIAPKGAQTGFGKTKGGESAANTVAVDASIEVGEVERLEKDVADDDHAFVHEYTHFQDQSRYKSPGVSSPSDHWSHPWKTLCS